MSQKKKYRLITRRDMDGLICAVLLKQLDMISEIKLVLNPANLKEGKIKVSAEDIITNLPYVPQAHLVIDHHISESLTKIKPQNHIIDPTAPSAARVVYDFFGGLEKFPKSFDSMLAAVDKADSGQFSMEDILSPKGWELLSFILDARSGLINYPYFRISYDQLLLNLVDHCRRLSISEILQISDIRERVEVYFNFHQKHQDQLKKCAKMFKNLVIIDYRQEITIQPGNRFLVYALFPESNITIRIQKNRKTDKTEISMGKSIFNPTSYVSIGKILMKYGGGGHDAAGSCHVENHLSETVTEELIKEVTDNPATYCIFNQKRHPKEP